MPCHHMHSTLFMCSENFDMHTLKQVYLYVVCVELYCLNQVQKFCLDLNFQENPDFQYLNPTLKTHFKI